MEITRSFHQNKYSVYIRLCNFVVLLVCDKFDRHVGTMVLPVCTVPWYASGAPEQGGFEQVRALLAGQVPLDTRSVLTGLRSAVANALAYYVYLPLRSSFC